METIDAEIKKIHLEEGDILVIKTDYMDDATLDAIKREFQQKTQNWRTPIFVVPPGDDVEVWDEAAREKLKGIL